MDVPWSEKTDLKMRTKGAKIHYEKKAGMTNQPTPLTQRIKQWGRELGFQQVAICDTDLSAYEPYLKDWLEKNFHGEMGFLAEHQDKRLAPKKFANYTNSIIIARMDYLPTDVASIKTLSNKSKAYIARYALGREYHKLIRKRLMQLAHRIKEETGSLQCRAVADSAPVLEKALAHKAGLGWIGKNTLLLNRNAGSWFFLGALLVDLTLETDNPTSQHCGTCTACIDICPTQAIVAPYQLDARRCISYLTIELKGSIPIELRPLIGNRIFGCDDCQLICPWNKFAKFTKEDGFKPRHDLDQADLINLFNWSEEEYLQKTLGSALRRAGYTNWLRNIAVALGNAPTSPEIITALRSRVNHESELVQEHVTWALKQHSHI